MVRQRVMITNPTGLHLRPAGIFCNTASSFKCKVTFEYDNTIANAKSVLIELICEGEDEEEALREMVAAVEGGLGE